MPGKSSILVSAPSIAIFILLALISSSLGCQAYITSTDLPSGSHQLPNPSRAYIDQLSNKDPNVTQSQTSYLSLQNESTGEDLIAGSGDQIRFDHLSVEHGLSDSSVNWIMQDSHGFIWLGTANGLNRYDGYNFHIFKHDPKDPRSLSNNTINQIIEDHQGILWIGTYGGGLNYFDRDKEQFIHYRHNPNDPYSLSFDIVSTLFEDSHGELWIGTLGGGLNRFDRENQRFILYQHDPNYLSSISDDNIVSIFEDSTGILWIGTQDGLNKFDSQTEVFTRYQHDSHDPASLSNNYVLSILEDNSGELWIGTSGGGLNKFDRHKEKFTRYQHNPYDPTSLSSDIASALLENSNGSLWVGTKGGGLNLFDPETGRFAHFKHDPDDLHSISDDYINSIFEDDEGIMWVGSTTGLNKYNRGREKFSHLEIIPNHPANIDSKMVFAIHEDSEGSFWIGTENGLYRWYPRENRFTHYQRELEDLHSLSDNWISTIYEDHLGILWIGTQGGLNRYDPTCDCFIRYQHAPDDLIGQSRDHINTVYEDRSGTIWFGTQAGLIKFDRDNGTLIHYNIFVTEADLLTKNRVSTIFEDHQGVFWVGTSGAGLKQFNRQTEQFVHIPSDPFDTHSLACDYIMDIYEGSLDRLWIGTNGCGLVYFDRQDKTFTTISTEEGLRDDLVSRIVEDNLGYLWLSTKLGLSKYDPNNEAIHNFDIGGGIRGNQLNGSVFYRQNGELLFGGNNGITIFNPELVQANQFNPPLVLTSLQHNGEDIETDTSLENLGQVLFQWPLNDFEFEFAALSYSQPENNQYAYILEGYDQDWNYIGANRFGRYTNLPGGTYTLRFKGSNNDGVWNEVGSSLEITIVPPFWDTWWFRGLIASLLITSIFLGYRLRVNSVESRSQELEQQVQERTREIEARRKELEALYHADVELHRHLDLDKVLNALVEVAVDILHCDKSSVFVWNDDQDHLVMRVARGFSQESKEVLSFKSDEGLMGQVNLKGEVISVEDTISDPRRRKEHPDKIETIIKEGIRSFMLIPIKIENEVFGVFNVNFNEPHAFGEDEQRLFVALAQRAAISIQTARLFRSEQRRAEQFLVISEVGRRMTIIIDVNELFNHVVRLVRDTFGYYHVAIGLIEGSEVVYRVGAGELWDDPDFKFKPARLKVGEEGLSGWVAGSGKYLLIPDISVDDRYVWMQGSKTRSELIVPIKIKEHVIGVLDIQSDRLDAFDDTDLAVIQSLAHQVGAAVENIRLHQQEQELAIVQERNRLARDLHDSAKQKAFAALAQLGASNRLMDVNLDASRSHLQEAESLVHDFIQEVVILIQEMHPVVLKERGLIAAIREYAFDWATQSDIEIDLQFEGECDLTLDVEQALYRIVQEALANVSRHSKANRVQVALICETKSISLLISDDGRGYDPQSIQTGLGTRSIRERVELIHANLRIDTAPGKGTHIYITLPSDDD